MVPRYHLVSSLLGKTFFSELAGCTYEWPAPQKMIQYSILEIIKKGSSDEQAKRAALKLNSCEGSYPIKCAPYDK